MKLKPNKRTLKLSIDQISLILIQFSSEGSSMLCWLWKSLYYRNSTGFSSLYLWLEIHLKLNSFLLELRIDSLCFEDGYWPLNQRDTVPPPTTAPGLALAGIRISWFLWSSNEKPSFVTECPIRIRFHWFDQ